MFARTSSHLRGFPHPAPLLSLVYIPVRYQATYTAYSALDLGPLFKKKPPKVPVVPRPKVTKVTKVLDLETALERQVLNPEHSETCKWGTDDEVGRHESSYDPSMTTPEGELLYDEEEWRLEGEEHSPLFVSPANREVSELLDPMVGGAVHCAERKGPSARGWTRKHREVHIKRVAGSQFERYDRLLERLRKQRMSAKV